MEDRPAYKKALFGLDPGKVASYLRQMKQLQQQQVSEIEQKINFQLAEQRRLQAEREELLASKQVKTDRLKYQELIQKRAQDAIAAMQRHTHEELNALQHQIDMKRSEHEQKIHNVETQTDYYNGVLQGLLQQIGATLQKFNTSELDILDEMFAQTVLPDADLDADPDEDAASLPENKSEKIVQFKLKSLSEQVSQLRNGTTDSAERENSVVMARMETAATYAAPAVSPAPVVVKPVATEYASSAFWGNIQQYVAGDVVVETTDMYTASQAQPQADVLVEERNIVSESAAQATASELKLVTKPQSPDTATTSAPMTAEESKGSEAVSAEINSIRNRYIVGKIAGEDLLDHQGRLVIAKGAVISAEVVDIAEREGKLPDLIVNMQMPGGSGE